MAVKSALGLEQVEVVNYTKQVVAGTKFQVKIKVGEEFWHCAVVQPLPHTNKEPFLMEGSLEKGKTLDDTF